MTIQISTKSLLSGWADSSTFAWVSALNDADPSQSKRQQERTRSAFNTVARGIGKPLERISALAPSLREDLKEVNAAMAGVSRLAWRNALSQVRSAIRRAGLAPMPGRYTGPMSAKWAALFAQLPKTGVRYGLSRFAGWCTERGIEPDQVTWQTFLDFLADLDASSIVKHPRITYNAALRSWNGAAALIEGWPPAIAIPADPRLYSVEWSIFPPSLKADIDAYLQSRGESDVFAEHERRPMKPGSLRTRTRQLLEYGSALAHRGVDPATLRSLADFVAVENVMEGMRFFIGRSKARKPKHAHDIVCLLKGIASHWVRVDAAHLEKLKAICKSLNAGRGMTEKNRVRLRPFDDPKNIEALYNLPQVMAARSIGSRTPRKRAMEVQMALAIELLIMVMMRLGNLVHLDLDRHIARFRGVVHLTIPGEEVKNGQPLEARLTQGSVALLDLYLEHRPHLMDGPSSALFPGRGGAPRSMHGFSRQISACIWRECGLRVNPHLLRHIGAKSYLEANPGNYERVRLALGHKSITTTTTYYCGTEDAAALRHFDDHVLSHRPKAPDAKSPRAKAPKPAPRAKAPRAKAPRAKVPKGGPRRAK